MKGKVRDKPYFEGQKRQPCGHYYPDVVRVKSIKKDGDYFNVLSCAICGEYIVKLYPERTSDRLIQLLDRDGVADITTKTTEEMEVYREENRRRLLTKQDKKDNHN